MLPTNRYLSHEVQWELSYKNRSFLTQIYRQNNGNLIKIVDTYSRLAGVRST
jgi:hypothetical protein